MVKISIVQFTPGLGMPVHNMEQVHRLLQGAQTDIIVLPELCTTGYSFISREETLAAAEGPEGQSVAELQRLAAGSKAMVIAGFAERAGDKVFNSALIALPDGQLKIYRKTHLFFREKECFDDGNSGFFVVKHPLVDCRIGIMICNDWRYPEAARTLALKGADVIACPSNLVSSVWGIGMPARALENKVYLAVSNRCGTETRELEDGSTQSLTFTGQSVLYDYNGSPMGQAGTTGDRVITMEIDPIAARDKSFNIYNDYLKDRRPEFYSN